MSARYPLMVTFERGRVQHSAREHNGRLITLCGATGVPVADPPPLPWCSACARKPNPINNRADGNRPSEPCGVAADGSTRQAKLADDMKRYAGGDV